MAMKPTVIDKVKGQIEVVNDNLVAPHRKALVPIAVAGVLAVLGWVGISGDMTVKEAVTLAVTAISVWFVRNKK